MGTSVPSERVFSVAGLAVTKTRARLSADVLDETIFLNKILDDSSKDTEGEPKEEFKIKQESDVNPSTSSEEIF